VNYAVVSAISNSGVSNDIRGLALGTCAALLHEILRGDEMELNMVINLRGLFTASAQVLYVTHPHILSFQHLTRALQRI